MKKDRVRFLFFFFSLSFVEEDRQTDRKGGREGGEG